MEATQNIAMMTFEGLMENLKACEVQMITDFEGTSFMESKLEAKKPKEEKNVAFKTSWKPRPRCVVESSDSDNDDVEALIRQFSRALMKKMGKSSGRNVNEKDVPICYRCNQPGHVMRLKCCAQYS